MAAEVRIVISSSASGGDLQQTVKDLRDVDAAARQAPGGFSVLGAAAGAALGGIVVNAATAATGAVVGFVGSSISVASDFEGAVNNLAAVSGSALADAGFSFDDVSAKALQLGQDTAFSASESIAAMTELVKGGIPVTEVMAEATDNTLALAAATGTDLASAAEIMSKQFGVWNETGTTSGQIADLLTQAANASTVGVEDLALGLAQAGGTAKTAGVEFEDLVQSMALIAPNFSSASDAGTSFKTFLSRLIPTTGPAIEAMTNLGLYTKEAGSAFYDQQGNFVGMEEAARLLQTATADLTEEERLLAFNTIFGADAIRAASAIANAGAEGFNAMGESMASAGTASETAAIQNQGFGFAMDSLKGSIETVQIVLGTALLPVLTQVVTITTDVINALMGNQQAFNDLAPPLQSLVLGLQGFGAQVMALMPLVQEIAAQIAANWQPALAAIGAIVAAVVIPALASFVVAAAPVIAAVAGAIAIGMALYNAWNTNFLGIQTITTNALAAVQGVITSVMGIVLQFWNENGTQIMTWAQTVWGRVQEIVGTVAAIVAEIVTRVFGAIQQFLNDHGADIQLVLNTAWANIQTVIDTTINTIQGVLNTILAVIKGDWSTAWEEIKTVATTVWDGVKTVISNNIELAKGLIQSFIDKMGIDLKGVLDKVGGFFEPFTSALSGIGSAIGEAMGFVQGLIDKFNALKDAIPDVLIPGSPTPFEVGMRGIASTLRSETIPAVQRLGGAMEGAAGGRTYNQQRSVSVTQTIYGGSGGFRQDAAIVRSLAGGI